MPNRFGRGRGAGFRSRGGMGLGFHGNSPPWPYIGLGRGGLPRCGYVFSGTNPPVYAAPSGSWTTGYETPPTNMTREEELDYLKNQAETVKSQLDEIESRMRNLETKG